MEGESSDEIQLLAEGKRALACGDYTSASSALENVCTIMSEKYGQMSDVLAEPYYLYGRALLELSRQENAVLGTGVPREEEQRDEDSGDEDDGSEDGDNGCSDDGRGSDSEKAPPIEATSKGGDGVSEGGTQSANGGQEGEEPSTLQVAWETLEVARLLCQKQTSIESQLRLAEISLLLGEVGLESDQFEQAVNDFTTCLQLREAMLTPDDRRLAEVHFQLGLAYSLASRMEECAREYSLAKQVLEIRKETLEQKLDKIENEEDKAGLRDEISEIDELLPSIDAKIADCEDGGDTTLKEVSLNKPGLVGDEAAEALMSSDTEVKDISHLVRKKTTATDNEVKDISHLVRKADKKGVDDRKRAADWDTENQQEAKKYHPLEENSSNLCEH